MLISHSRFETLSVFRLYTYVYNNNNWWIRHNRFKHLRMFDKVRPLVICCVGVQDVYLQLARGDGRGVTASPNVRVSDLSSRFGDTFVNCSWVATRWQ
jgi:hypothetical protein